MFSVESYVTPILLSYVDKYVKDFRPADAQVSLWGGGVALHNLVLKADVLQQELSLPFTLVSGRIHELLIQVPWTKIISEPVVVTINTIECVLSLNPPDTAEDNPPADQPRQQIAEDAQGYMESLVRRVVANISVRVNSLIVKYVHDDVVLSLNVKRLTVDCVDGTWQPAFTDIEPNNFIMRRLVRLDDLTLCLDRSDSDGKIRHYQDPLLYRCQLEIRLLMSVTTLHKGSQSAAARNLSVQVRSKSLEWGVTSEQLILLLRLLRERPQPPPRPPRVPQAACAAPAAAASSNAAETAPNRESWTEWAWSWLPVLKEADDAKTAVYQGKPFPIMFSAFFDKVSFVYKVTETEIGSNRKRTRPLLELTAHHTIMTYLVIAPTTLRVRIGARTFALSSQGKCVCGHLDQNALQDKPTLYVKPNFEVDEHYEWPEGIMEMKLVKPNVYPGVSEEIFPTGYESDPEYPQQPEEEDEDGYPPPELEPLPEPEDAFRHASAPHFCTRECVEKAWFKMAPIVFLQYEHDREEPININDPYESPPKDFENSDWVERVQLSITMRPVRVRVCTGLIHRLELVHELLQDLPPVARPEIVVRPLTVEECDALTEYTPERKIAIRLIGLVVQFTPWDHSLSDQPGEPIATVQLQTNKINVNISGPLYPSRVCAAACQMPDKMSELYDLANLRFSVNIMGATGHLETPVGRVNRPIFKFTAYFSGQFLLNSYLFEDNDTVHFSGIFTLPTEATMYMTAPAIETVVEVARSLLDDRVSTLLRDTTLAVDAMEEKDITAVDGVLTKLQFSPRVGRNAVMATVHVHSIKITGVQLRNGMEENVAWLFSAPDNKMSKEWMMFRFQYCPDASVPDALNYVFVETEVCAVSLDPLLMTFLTYRPRMRPQTKPMSKASSAKTMSSSKYFIRRRTTPPSSSGRGSRSGSAAELVHTRTRSAESTSERSERRERRDQTEPLSKKQLKLQGKRWDNEAMLGLYSRLRHTLLRLDIGLVMVYTVASTASALETSSVRDAMERHARHLHRVLVFSCGRWDIRSSGIDISDTASYHKPTFLPREMRSEETFPWRIKVVDISSYTLETSPPARLTDEDRELVRTQSQSRTTIHTVPRTMLALMNCNMTISVLTKTKDTKKPPPPPDTKRPPPPTQEDQKKKYFTSGIDFKPMTLRDFIRGPAARPGARSDGRESPEPRPEPNPSPEQQSRGDGPLVSLGLCIHGDTPPVNLTLAHDQVHIVRAAIHCLAHMWALLKKPRTPIAAPKPRVKRPGSAPLVRPVISSSTPAVALEQRSSSEETPSENPSEKLIPIFQRTPAQDSSKQLRLFVWFQWVMYRASISFTTEHMMLTLDLDDAIATVDIQENYDQFRFKIATGTILYSTPKENTQPSDWNHWEPGPMGGRVLDTRETPDGKSAHFFATTVTRARFADLPPNWREDLIIKRNRQNALKESMWEIFISMAPLEVMLHPQAVRGLSLVGTTLLLNSFCPVQLEQGRVDSEAAIQETESHQKVKPVPMPFLHVDLGGMRFILNDGQSRSYHDDTVVVQFGSATVLPYPDNPICRRSINTVGEANWIPAASGCEGRQHELIIKGFSVRTSRIQQLMKQMAELQERSKRNVNPAANWAEPLPRVMFTPILHNTDVSGVIAPPVFLNGALACGPALEINVASDVNVEISFEQLELLTRLLRDLYAGYADLHESEDDKTILDVTNWCPFSELLVFDEEEDDDDGEDAADEAAAVSDSGMDMDSQPSTSRVPPPQPPKKAVSIASAEPLGPFDHVEVFFVMGRVDIALYVRLDRSAAVQALRLPALDKHALQAASRKADPEPSIKIVIEPIKAESPRQDPEPEFGEESRSLTENVRQADVGRSRLNVVTDVKFVRRSPMYAPVVHVTLNQPNMYYWRKMNIKGLQMSLFNAWVALGEGQDEKRWHQPLLSTKPGAPDPDTDIPPSLLSARFDSVPASSLTDKQQWAVQVDIERPVVIDITEDSIHRIKCINELFAKYLGEEKSEESDDTHPLNKIHESMTNKCLEKLTVKTGQVALRWEPWTGGADGVSVQLCTARHPERLCARALLSALLLTTQHLTHGVEEPRHILLQPVMVGLQAEVSWKPALSEEVTITSLPAIRVALEMDDVAISVRPVDANHAFRIHKTIKDNFGDKEEKGSELGTDIELATERKPTPAPSPDDIPLLHEVYYKDDLRSGAFKIMSGEKARMPMAYEVSLRSSTVVWHYPVPRLIARIVALPLPDCDVEADCVLESYNPLLGRWEANTYFQIPVAEKKEFRIYRPNNDKIFAHLWRVRLVTNEPDNLEPFEFKPTKYVPQDDPVVRFSSPAEEWPAGGCIAAEQLAGALRVDSYLAAHLESRVHVALRFGTLAFHAYSDTPPDPPLYPNYIDLPHFEGMFVTLALRRSHRALSLVTRSAALNAIAHAGARLLSCECMLGLDIYESETGTMERLVEDFRLQAVFNATHQRMRVRAGDVRIMMNAPRVRTLHMMQNDWKSPYYMLFDKEEYPDYEEPDYVESAAIESDEHVEYTWNSDRLMVLECAEVLDGRVYLYVVNSCDAPLRFGQEGTDEILTLNARTTLAYRWNSPLAPKRLRFAMYGTSTDVHWSQCIPYSVGQHRVRLVEENEDVSNSRSADGVFLHARVEDAGDRLYMHLGGRVVLCNLLRDDLSYKVRIRDPTAEDGMRVIASGDMRAQSVGLTVLCTTAVRDAYLKIKFEAQPNGWTGDIPLKECPKEHVPWLVKVPSVGEVPCVSAWCRVERSADRRVAVLLTPMFVMCSHLPLDVNVSMTTDPLNEEEASTSNTPVLTQDAMGRGHITQLRAYGTTTVRHSLTFRYKTLLDCKVTQDTVPLHYGLTERSVFENHSPPPTADEMVADALAWINTSTSEAKREWPYSPARNHWPGRWHATAAQPRCDVLVRYHPIRVCGGGCGMMMHVLPRVLVCNASSATLTIRADNGSPHCRLEPGSVSAPPSDIIANPFYVSIDEDNYANLSSELCVSREDPGVYGLLPSGKLAVDRTTDFIIHYKDRVAFLTMHYTMHMEIHVFGMTSTYLFINKLDTEIIISPTVVQNLPGHEDNPILRPKAYQTVRTCKDELKCGVRITDFWLCGRYFPNEMKYLRPFLCFSLPDENGLPAAEAVPVQLGLGLSRRSISLRDQYGQSIPVVVTQIKHEGRWIVTAALEPCPQFAVHNHTDEPLALGHLRRNHEAFFKDAPIMPELIGVKWWNVLEPGAWSYYSTLWHMEHTSCTSMPNRAEKPEVPQLAVGRVFREFEPEWSTPFQVVEGEHLVQLTHELRIKVKIQKHPHSTNIDLLNVDEDDVSAMEIRERLAQRNAVPQQAWLTSDLNKINDQEKLRLMQGEWQEELERDAMEAAFRPGKDFEPGSSKTANQTRENEESASSITQRDLDSETSLSKEEMPKTGKSDMGASDPPLNDWLRAVVGRVVVELAASCNVRPLLRATVDRVALLLHSDAQMLYCALTASDFQLDNTQHATRRFDFAVVATTCSEPRADETFPALWGMFVAERDFDIRLEASNVVLRVSCDRWTVCDRHHQQVGVVDLYVGPTHLYLEDSFIRESMQLIHLLVPQPELTPSQLVAAEAAALSNPLRLALLHIHQLRLTLTVHTAVRLYIAVDHSTLSLSSFRLENMVTTPDKLMHDLTVHYLSGVILGAGWVVGGLELLGAPGALAARVANARGGLRGFMATTAAAVLRSVNACAGSLARNLDLLAGDDEHTQRAAAARRIHPPTFMAGISAGFQNFAVNMLGAVGGLAHHPLVGVAVGEASGAAALRRGLLGALAKPLSATADLLAFAGQGLLSQTGWDPDPKQRVLPPLPAPLPWRRDCVRWAFRLHALPALFGVDATLDDQPVRLVVTDKFLVVAEPTTERIVEMIDYRFCRLVSFDGQVVDMRVTQRRPHARRDSSERSSSEVYPHSSSAAMARVARYAGVGGGARDGQAVRLRTAPYAAPALAAALAAALHQDQPTHFALL